MNQRLQRVDFRQSDIRWVTSQEKSRGAFQIDAVMRLWAGADALPRLFALGSAVLAGNMYVDTGLRKDPPYMFQVAVGDGNHVIFITDMSYGWPRPIARLVGWRAVTDSTEPNNRIFDSFDINLDMESAEPIQNYEEIEAYYSQRDRFSGLITMALSSTGKIELEFPVKHLNLLPTRGMWQFETGPVLFPKQGLAASLSDCSVADFLPYFVHSNRFDSAEFSPISLFLAEGRLVPKMQ